MKRYGMHKGLVETEMRSDTSQKGGVGLERDFKLNLPRICLKTCRQCFHQHRGSSEYHPSRTESWNNRNRINFNSINESLCRWELLTEISATNWGVCTDKKIHLISLDDHIRVMAVTRMKNAAVMFGLIKCSISRRMPLAKALLSPHKILYTTLVFINADIKLGHKQVRALTEK